MVLSRTRVWVKGEIGDFFDFMVEGRDARVWGDDEFRAQDHPVFEDDFDLFQAYITAHLSDELSVRVGREMLNFDDQRLVGGLLWTNTSRSFDVAHMIYDGDSARIDLGAARVVRIRPHKANQQNHDDNFFFLHTTAKQTPVAGMKASLFGFYRNTELADGSDRDQYTVGARFWGDVGETGCFYDFTGAYQFGQVDSSTGRDADISAYALHGELGHAFDCAWEPKWSIEGNWASGDSNPGGGDIHTFDQLYPTNHTKYGIADLVGWENQRNVGMHLKLKPNDKTTALLSYFAFWVDSANDSLYNAGGGASVRNTSGSGDTFVGQEVDGVISYDICDNVNVGLGVGYFFAGDYVDNNTANGDDFLFGFLQTVVKIH